MNMKNILNKFNETIHKHIFFMCSRKMQNYLIEKNACMFLGLQNLACKVSNNGEITESMEISSESYKYLFKFIKYCKFKGISASERLKMYK